MHVCSGWNFRLGHMYICVRTYVRTQTDATKRITLLRIRAQGKYRLYDEMEGYTRFRSPQKRIASQAHSARASNSVSKVI